MPASCPEICVPNSHCFVWPLPASSAYPVASSNVSPLSVQTQTRGFLLAPTCDRVPYFRLTPLILLCVEAEIRESKRARQGRESASRLGEQKQKPKSSLGCSCLKHPCTIPTIPAPAQASLYDLWSLGSALPIPLRVHFSDKQKHIQALAPHFTLCALASGDAFLKPLACSPKNGSSWLSFKKKNRGGRGGEKKKIHMWRIRLHLASSTLCAHSPPSLPSSLPKVLLE